MACFSQCSMPLYVYCFFSFVTVSLFCQCSMTHLMCFFRVFFPMVVLFCQCSMPLYLYCFIFLLCLRTVWPMLYASFLYFFFSFVPVSWFMPIFYPSLFIFFSFLLCPWLGFTNDLCLPYLYSFLFLCVFCSFLSMCYFSFLYFYCLL